MRVVYGIDSKTYDDKFIQIAEAASETVALAMMPGKFLVDIIPARKCICISGLVVPFFDNHSVRYVPEWFPGARFQKLGRKWKATVDIFRSAPFDFTKNAMVNPQKCVHLQQVRDFYLHLASWEGSIQCRICIVAATFTG